MLGLGLNNDEGSVEVNLHTSLLAEKDAHVSADDDPPGYQNTNYNAANLKIQIDYGYGLYSLLDFDLSDLIGKQIIKATLKLNVESFNVGAEPALSFGIKIIEEEWTENTVTYSTRPSISDIFYAESSITEAGLIEIDVKTLLQAVADGATYYGMWLYVLSGINAQFTSREGTEYPVLDVEYS